MKSQKYETTRQLLSSIGFSQSKRGYFYENQTGTRVWFNTSTITVRKPGCQTRTVGYKNFLFPSGKPRPELSKILLPIL